MKNSTLKIAIYSGSIPGTTFIEQLIAGVSEYHQVLLFGRKAKEYQKKQSVRIVAHGNSTIKNILITFGRTILLAVQNPKRIKVLRKQLQSKRTRYQKRQAWIKITPVLLHLPNVFHIQWAKDLDSWLFLKELGVKIVLSLRGAHINYSPIANEKLAVLYRQNFPKVTAFHAVSKAIALEAQKYGTVPEKIQVIHSLIPQTTFDIFQLPQEKKEKTLKIISVGRYHWKKGYTTALDACKILKDKNISFSYQIIANGTVPEELIYHQKTLDLSNEVSFKKGLLQQELFNYMQQSDVLLLPSLEEGIANVVLEAMAIGLPVISTDCGGMKEVVIPGKTGWIVPVLEATIMVNAIEKYSNTTIEGRRQIAQNAKELVKEKFHATKGVHSFIEFYENLYKHNAIG